jgi:hypothetical protein
MMAQRLTPNVKASSESVSPLCDDEKCVADISFPLLKSLRGSSAVAFNQSNEYYLSNTSILMI